jgi:hypothetical protein
VKAHLDIEAGSEWLLPFARKRLRVLEDRGGHAKNFVLPGGETVELRAGPGDGYRLIRIRGGARHAFWVNPLTKAPAVMSPILLSDLAFPGQDPVLVQLGVPAEEIPEEAHIVGVRGGKVCVYKPSAHSTVDAFKRAVSKSAARGLYGIAERLMRGFAGDVDLDDAALACDEGFFIDPAYFEGKSYYSRIEGLITRYARSFVHVAAPTRHEPGDSFPSLGLSEYKPALVETPARQFEIAGEFYPGVDYKSVGTALVDTDLLRASPPLEDPELVGETVTARVAHFRPQADRVLADERAYYDAVTVDRLEYKETYYLVGTLVSPPGFLFQGYRTRTIPALPFGVVVGQASGYGENVVTRVQYRRSPDGWVQTTSDRHAPTTYHSITVDGNHPDITVEEEGEGGDVPIVFEYADGSTSPIAKSAYVGSTFSLDSVGLAARFGSSMYYSTPTGTYEDFALYQTPTPVFLAAVYPALHRFTSGGTVIERRANGYIHVMVEGVERAVIPPTTPGDWTAQSVFGSAIIGEASQWAFPECDTADAFMDDGRLSVQLNGYAAPSRMTRPVICPPADVNVWCVYQSGTEKYVYFKLTDAASQGAARTAMLRWLCAEANNEPKATRDARKAAFVAYFTTLADGGLPVEFAAFSLGLAGGFEGHTVVIA